MSNKSIVVERTFNAPVSKVWKAITNKDEMKKWYFDLSEFKPEKGFKFEFTGGDEAGKQYLHHCEIMEVITEKKLAYTWRYEDVPGNSLVTFELFEEGEKTLLRLTHEGVESFATDDVNFARKSFEGGWDHIVNISLKDYLEAGSVSA